MVDVFKSTDGCHKRVVEQIVDVTLPQTMRVESRARVHEAFRGRLDVVHKEIFTDEKLHQRVHQVWPSDSVGFDRDKLFKLNRDGHDNLNRNGHDKFCRDVNSKGVDENNMPRPGYVTNMNKVCDVLAGRVETGMVTPDEEHILLNPSEPSFNFDDSMIDLHRLSQMPSSCLFLQLSVCATGPRILTNVSPSHVKTSFCTELQDLVPRQRSGDCLLIHIPH